MKILLFGKNGQVGWELQRALAPLGSLIALDRNATELCGDLGQPDRIAETVVKVAPDFVVNAAAYTAVDRAEAEPDQAMTINARAPGALSAAARSVGAWVVDYSTDYVFDGSGDRAWTEDDPTGPINVYGQTKLEGERAIRAGNAKHLILRTSWVFAARGNNFVKTMVQLAQQRDHMAAVDDQWGAPTGADLIADATAHAIRRVSVAAIAEEFGGVYHLVASGTTNRHKFTEHIVGKARQLRPDLPWLVKEIAPARSDAFPTAARRPGNSRLNGDKFQRAFGLELPPWEEGVDRMLEETLGRAPPS